MISKPFIITVLILLVLSVYLFASAPAPLPEQRPAGERIPIAQVFNVVEAENDVVRALWTKEIVGAGKQVGLAFNEDWREEDVQAGPLPALFLRETAVSLEKNPVRLSLYLGSDYPIKPANKFTAAQMEKFKNIRKTGEPQFFLEQDTGLHTAMFSDIAVVDACIDCHNKHKESPKSDWKLGDVMGATTWSYPEDAVTLDELMKILTALRQGFREAYTAYLTKVERFANRPQIGDKWPRDGFYLPTVDVFMKEAVKRASESTLVSMLAALTPQTPEQKVASSPADIRPSASAPTKPKAVLAVATPIATETILDHQANSGYEVFGVCRSQE
ncbi:MAG: c-type heme family protein [Gammaproteobacteria bacterium]